jgi:hypothetical protein
MTMLHFSNLIALRNHISSHTGELKALNNAEVRQCAALDLGRERKQRGPFELGSSSGDGDHVMRPEILKAQ